MSNNPKNILFRADSSSNIGTGHIMRDLVLAEQFKDANIIFATQDLPDNINHKIEEKDYVTEILNSNDVEELDALIKKLSIDMIVIDHYGIGHNFEKKLKIQNSKLKIFSFDDTFEKHYCDILLNHNQYGNPDLYKGLVPENCELRCGPKYTLLREEFIEEKQKGRQNKNNEDHLYVFVAMGGTDHSNINIPILEVLKKFPNMHAHVVTTSANQHLKELQEYIQHSKNATLHLNTNSIAKLMSKADFAIVTPSVTINEVFYMYMPFIAIKTAENQKYMYKYLIEHNYKVCSQFNSQMLFDYLSKIQKELK